MYEQIYTAASNALDTIAPLLSIAFHVGSFILTIHVFGGYIVEVLLSFLQDVWMCIEPISYSLLYIAIEGGMLHAELTFSDEKKDYVCNWCF